MTLICKCCAWPFLVAGFLAGFFIGALWEGFGGGYICVQDLIQYHIVKSGGKNAT